MIATLISEIFYRPVLNLIFGLHSLLPAGASFGISLILFAVLVRVIITVATSSQSISESQQENLDRAIGRIESQYAGNPVKQKAMVGKLMRENSFGIIITAIGLFIQVIVILALFRFFTHDLASLDRLVYSFLTVLDVRFQFMGIDLTAANQGLAVMTSLGLFLYLTFSTVSLLSLTSRTKAFQYLIPLITWFFLAGLPAAVALFLLTSTLFSLMLFMVNDLLGRFRRFTIRAKLAQADAEVPSPGTTQKPGSK